MKKISFAPQQLEQSAQSQEPDALATRLFLVARVILLVVVGTLPIFFIPLEYTPLGYSKILFLALGIFTALIFFGLGALRAGTVRLRLPTLLWSMWAIVGVAFVSLLFSGDFHDALIGNRFDVHTVAFVALLAAVFTVVSILGSAKVSAMRLYMLLAGSALLLSVYHVSRFIFGPEFLSFGIFTSATATPIGSWNDLGLFFGLTLLLALVAIEQLPLTKIGRTFFVIVSAASLLILMVVNFSLLWIILAGVSLVMLVYSLTRGKFKRVTLAPEADQSKDSMLSLMLSLVIFIVSVTFFAAGPFMGERITALTDTQYVEVRPSFSATFAIADSVFEQNALLGIGPNKFSDAWLQYRDPSINETLFWNTRFSSGIGYIPTTLVTTGILGVVSWLLFFALILIAGFKILFRTTHTDRGWFFIGLSSFVASVYLWLIAIFYVPGPAILLLAAACSGLLLAAYNSLTNCKQYTVSLLQSRRLGFAVVALIMVMIVGSLSLIYQVGVHYTGLVMFNKAQLMLRDGGSVSEFEQRALRAYEMTQNAVFVRALANIQLSKMESLLPIAEPTTNQQETFQAAAVDGIEAARRAIERDREDPENWLVLGRIYSVLAAAGMEDAVGSAREAFDRARAIDGVNPSYVLVTAQLYLRVGNVDEAQSLTEEAINLKRNYTDAYYLLAQIAVLQEDIPAAIDATRASIQLDPNNPARLYQLGVLHWSSEQPAEAAVALERAVAIDPNYANARYFLAFAYDALGRSNEARQQLQRVQELNPDNSHVSSLLSQLASGEPISVSSEITSPIEEPGAVSDEGDAVLSPSDPNSPLLSPVNAVPGADAAEPDVDADTDTTADDESSSEETSAATSTES